MFTTIDKELVKNVIKLARRRRINYTYQGGHISEEKPQTDEYIKAKEELETFMSNLSFDEVKYLQSIMYLGRDTSTEELQKFNGEILLQKQYESLSWENKDIEIRQMLGKTPLDEYLQKGLEILN